MGIVLTKPKILQKSRFLLDVALPYLRVPCIIICYLMLLSILDFRHRGMQWTFRFTAAKCTSRLDSSMKSHRERGCTWYARIDCVCVFKSAGQFDLKIRAIDRNLNHRRYLPCEKSLHFECSSELHHLSMLRTIVGGAIPHHHCLRPVDSHPLSEEVCLAKE